MKKIPLYNKVLSRIAYVKRDLGLLLYSPREYLYSYTYSKDKKITIYPYDPRVTKTGERIVRAIRAKFPELAVHLIGSASLKISGQRDIDILVECERGEFAKYLSGFVALFGKEDKKRPLWTEWHFIQDGSAVEIMLIDPKTRVFQEPMRTYNILAHNKKALKEYEHLKHTSNGITEREYKKVRLDFFNRL